MNKQVQKLAEQAGIWQPTFDHKTWVRGEYVASLGELEKFAELIVRECVIQCEQEWIRHGTHSVHNQAIHGCINRIKKQFGVDQ